MVEDTQARRERLALDLCCAFAHHVLLPTSLTDAQILTIASFMLDSGPGGIMRAAAGAGPSEFKPSPGTQPVTFKDVCVP